MRFVKYALLKSISAIKILPENAVRNLLFILCLLKSGYKIRVFFNEVIFFVTLLL